MNCKCGPSLQQEPLFPVKPECGRQQQRDAHLLLADRVEPGRLGDDTQILYAGLTNSDDAIDQAAQPARIAQAKMGRRHAPYAMGRGRPAMARTNGGMAETNTRRSRILESPA